MAFLKPSGHSVRVANNETKTVTRDYMRRPLEPLPSLCVNQGQEHLPSSESNSAPLIRKGCAFSAARISQQRPNRLDGKETWLESRQPMPRLTEK